MTNGGRHRNSPPRIMIVDDEKDVLAILRSGLQTKGGFVVETFNEGEAALQAFASQAPDYYDVVLTDIRMPKMNGFELYRKIREKNLSVPIAFITAFEINEEEFSKVMPSIKVRDFIKKPIRIHDLVQRLNTILAAA
jgi:CheY-like chemotaxis protein